MIDTHCHLTDPRLHAQLDDVLNRARAAGVDRLVSIGTGVDDSRATADLAGRHDDVFAVVGVHPAYSHRNPPDPTPQLRELIGRPKVVALGEMGLDFHWDAPPAAPRDVQEVSFRNQLALAAEVDLPVVIHSRKAIPETLAVMADFPSVRGVFHCFTDKPANVEAILAAGAGGGGHYVGFTGPLTYKKSSAIRSAAKLVPLDRLLVETDAPYLSPEPVRKHKTCEPAFVAHTLAKLAEVRGLGVEEMDAVTTRNAETFYRLPPCVA